MRVRSVHGGTSRSRWARGRRWVLACVTAFVVAGIPTLTATGARAAGGTGGSDNPVIAVCPGPNGGTVVVVITGGPVPANCVVESGPVTGNTPEGAACPSTWHTTVDQETCVEAGWISFVDTDCTPALDDLIAKAGGTASCASSGDSLECPQVEIAGEVAGQPISPYTTVALAGCRPLSNAPPPGATTWQVGYQGSTVTVCVTQWKVSWQDKIYYFGPGGSACAGPLNTTLPYSCETQFSDPPGNNVQVSYTIGAEGSSGSPSPLQIVQRAGYSAATSASPNGFFTPLGNDPTSNAPNFAPLTSSFINFGQGRIQPVCLAANWNKPPTGWQVTASGPLSVLADGSINQIIFTATAEGGHEVLPTQLSNVDVKLTPEDFPYAPDAASSSHGLGDSMRILGALPADPKPFYGAIGLGAAPSSGQVLVNAAINAPSVVKDPYVVTFTGTATYTWGTASLTLAGTPNLTTGSSYSETFSGTVFGIIGSYRCLISVRPAVLGTCYLYGSRPATFSVPYTPLRTS